MNLNPKTFELHISTDPEFTRKFGKRVKAAGGSYRAARGDSTCRFVFVPNTEEGRALGDEILRAHPLPVKLGHLGSTCVIMRGMDIRFPARIEVVYAESATEALIAYEQSLQSPLARKIIEDRRAKMLHQAEADARRAEVCRLVGALTESPLVQEFVESMMDKINGSAQIKLTGNDVATVIVDAVAFTAEE